MVYFIVFGAFFAPATVPHDDSEERNDSFLIAPSCLDGVYRVRGSSGQWKSKFSLFVLNCSDFARTVNI